MKDLDDKLQELGRGKCKAVTPPIVKRNDPLKAYQQELIEQVEILRMGTCPCEECGGVVKNKAYNQAIDDVLAILKDTK